MATTDFVFYFSEDIEERSNKFLISSLFGEILSSGQEDISIFSFFSENAIYALLHLPPYFQKAIKQKKINLFINDSQAKALLGAFYPRISWLRDFKCVMLNSNEFFHKYSVFAAKNNNRLLKM